MACQATGITEGRPLDTEGPHHKQHPMCKEAFMLKPHEIACAHSPPEGVLSTNLGKSYLLIIRWHIYVVVLYVMNMVSCQQRVYGQQEAKWHVEISTDGEELMAPCLDHMKTWLLQHVESKRVEKIWVFLLLQKEPCFVLERRTIVQKANDIST